MLQSLRYGLIGVCLTLPAGCSQSGRPVTAEPLPIAPANKSGPVAQPEGGGIKVKFETSKGDFVVRVFRDWAPNGADRFEELVGEGYYNGLVS